jgi:hypothetical protein
MSEQWGPDVRDVVAANAEHAAKGKPRQCNRHFDCEEADRKAKAAGRFLYADHCHDDCCEDCFGS